MGFGASPSFGAGEALATVMLVVFAGLLIWGFFSGLDALLPSPSLLPQRRLALRWIGLNRLEPSLTSLLLLVVFIARIRAETPYSPVLNLWFLLPALSFLGVLLPPVWFTAGHDRAIQNVWRGLRQIAIARVSPYLLIGLSLRLGQAWLGIGTLPLGLAALFWSWRVLGRLAAQLNKALQPAPVSQRMSSDAG